MADMRGASQFSNYQEKARESKTRALELCSIALGTANDLFNQGDLSPYLTMLTRFHWYNFYNLLLLLKQYPNATHLRVYRTWANMIGDPTKSVLKAESKGKGIEMIAPFTDLQPQGTRALSWYSIKQFDISQTNVKNFESPQNNYLAGEEHTGMLIKVLCRELHRKYGLYLLFDLKENIGAGYIESGTIHCREDLCNAELVLWLTECFIAQGEPEKVIGDKYRRTFIHMAQHCLLRIWGYTDKDLLFLYQNKELIRSISAELRPVFLDLLQRRVRQTEETIYSSYTDILNEEPREVPEWTSILPPG